MSVWITFICVLARWFRGLGYWYLLSTSDALFGSSNSKGWSCCGHNLSKEMTDL